MADKKLQPIIVKRVKKAGHAAHGGAWKIAYADFVTAMMAFFLLMWLLGSTAQGELQGIASYFQNPVKVAMQGGNGAGNSSSIIPGGGNDLSKAVGQVHKSTPETRKTRTVQSQAQEQGSSKSEAARAEVARKDALRIEALRDKIDSLITVNPKLAEYRSQIRLEITPDGLQIQIVDDQKRAMFDSGSALVKPYMRDILREIGGALNGVQNRISLAGHTDATPYGNGDRGYSNWELSADRANATRRDLVAAGMPDAKMVRVVGLASSDLMDPENPRSPTNRRISITVMTHEAEERLLGTDRNIAKLSPAETVEAVEQMGAEPPRVAPPAQAPGPAAASRPAVTSSR
ncbi:MAG: flagellar motor protein MotB [Xylophilus ampelinus]